MNWWMDRSGYQERMQTFGPLRIRMLPKLCAFLASLGTPERLHPQLHTRDSGAFYSSFLLFLVGYLIESKFPSPEQVEDPLQRNEVDQLT